MSIAIIVALDSANGIGINNTLPWRLAEDMAHFKRTTSGHTVIMGRKTFDSIGKALPNRRNIVITRDSSWQHDGVSTAHSVPEALALTKPDEQVFIIGGAQIYAATLPVAERLIVTQINQSFACDAFFPTISAQEWQIIASEEHFSQQNDCSFVFLTYQRSKSVDTQ